MGNSGSQADIGDQLYEIVCRICNDDAEQVTGMILEMGDEEVQRLLNDNPSELSRQIQRAAKLVKDKRKNTAENQSDAGCPIEQVESGGGNNKGATVHALRNLILRVLPEDDGSVDYIASRLLEMTESERRNMMLTSSTLLATINVMRDDWEQLGDKQASSINPNIEIKKESSHSLDEAEHEIADRVFEKVLEWHPLHADRFTAVLVDLDIVTLQHMLASDLALSEKLCTVATSFCSSQQITESSIKNDLGEVLFKRVAQSLAEDQASKVTGMLLDQDLRSIYHLCGDHALLSATIERAVDVLNKKSQTNTS